MLDEQKKRRILEILLEKFSLQEEIHMAVVGKYLREKGEGATVHGYKKMKTFMQDLKEIMRLQERIMNGVPQTLVILHEYEDQSEDDLWI